VVHSIQEPSREREEAICSEIEPTAIRRVAQYLEEHYTDSNLNLSSIAHMFGFNPSYLSRRFKSEIGKSFVELLTECRMKKAMSMAKENEKMFITATAVGIPDPNYFGRCFKKHLGISYSEYCKRTANS